MKTDYQHGILTGVEAELGSLIGDLSRLRGLVFELEGGIPDADIKKIGEAVENARGWLLRAYAYADAAARADG